MLSFEQFPFGWRDITDILLVTFCLYYALRYVQGSRVMAALKGIMVLLVIYAIAKILGLFTLIWLLESFFGSIFLVIVILFSEDIKHALVSMNPRSFFVKKKKVNEDIIQLLVNTCFAMAAKKIGAIIVLERDVPLEDLMHKGVRVDGLMSHDLLQTIFHPLTALHDGAVIVKQDGRIGAAGCVLPLSNAIERQNFGTRHRAAIGVTEMSDAVVLVVSEERGEVTVAHDGRLSNPLNHERMERILSNVLN